MLPCRTIRILQTHTIKSASPTLLVRLLTRGWELAPEGL